MQHRHDPGIVTAAAASAIAEGRAPEAPAHPALPTGQGGALFPDEPIEGIPGPQADAGPSVFDQFADENAAVARSSRGSGRAARRSPSNRARPPLVALGRQASLTPARLVTVFVIAAALTFAGVRACQTGLHAPPPAISSNR